MSMFGMSDQKFGSCRGLYSSHNPSMAGKALPRGLRRCKYDFSEVMGDLGTWSSNLNLIPNPI